MRALPRDRACKVQPRKVFSHDSFHCTLLLRNSEASTAEVHDGTTPASTELVIIHVTLVVGSWRLLTRSQREGWEAG